MGRRLTWYERSARERRIENERAARRSKREREVRERRAKREKEKAAEKREKERDTRSQEKAWESQVRVFDDGIAAVNNPFHLVKVGKLGKRLQMLREEFTYVPPAEPELKLPTLRLPNAPAPFRFVERRQLADLRRRTEKTLDAYYSEKNFKPIDPKAFRASILGTIVSATVTVGIWMGGAPLGLSVSLLCVTAFFGVRAFSAFLRGRATEQMREEYSNDVQVARALYAEELKREQANQEEAYRKVVEAYKVKVEEAQKKHSEAEQRAREKHGDECRKYKSQIALDRENFALQEAQRMAIVEQAMNGDPTAMALFLEARFPLRFTLKETEDLEFTAEDLNDHEIAYRVVSNEEVTLALSLPPLEFLPDQGLKLSPNRKKLTYYDISEREKQRYYANYLCGTSLVYCAAVAEVLPTVKTVRIETDTPVKNPASGRTETSTVLQAAIDVTKLKRLSYSKIDPQAAIETLQATWTAPWDPKRHRIERSIDREALAYATEEDEAVEIEPHFKSIFDRIFGDSTDSVEEEQ